MAWTKASLKLVFLTEEQKENGDYKTKSKSFSHLKQDANEGACQETARAIAGLQDLELVGLSRVDYTDYTI